MSAGNRIGALLMTPLGFVVGGFIGEGIGYVLSVDPAEHRAQYGRHYIPKKIPQSVLKAERTGGIIGAALGATAMAVLAAGGGDKDAPKQVQPGVSGVLSRHNPRFP